MAQAKASVVSRFPSIYQNTADTDQYHHHTLLFVTRILRSHCDIQSTMLPLAKEYNGNGADLVFSLKNSCKMIGRVV